MTDYDPTVWEATVTEITAVLLNKMEVGIQTAHEEIATVLGLTFTTEQIQDIVGALIAAGTGITATYNDAGNVETISVDPEAIQDIVGAFLAAGSGITVTYNDAGNVETIGLSTEAVQDIVGAFVADSSSIDVTYDDSGNAETMVVNPEWLMDTLATTILAGTGMAASYNDSSGTLTFSATGGALTLDLPMRRSRRMFARRSDKPIDILMIGHSIVEGFHADVLGERVSDVLLDNLRALFQPAGVTGGVGYCRISGDSSGGHSYTRWTHNGTTVTTGGMGMYTAAIGAGGTHADLVFTGTDIDLVYGTWSGAATTVTVKIDGTTVDTFSANAATEYGKVRRVWSGTLGTHTLNITANSDFSLEGAMVYNGDTTTGVRMWEAGHSGFKAQDFAGAAAGAWDGAIDVIKPAVVVIWLDINDVVAGRTASQWEADIRTIITRSKAQYASSSFVLVKPYAFSGVPLATAQAYGAKADLIASDTANVVTCDLLSLFGDFSDSANADILDLLWTDVGHPATYGMTMAADALTDIIAFGGGRYSTSGSSVATLNDLTDVVITSPATNDVVKFNGTNFVNSPVSGSDSKRGAVTKLTKTSDQSFSAGVPTVPNVSWTAETVDEGGLWASGSPTILTIPSDGWLKVTVQASCADATFMAVQILANSIEIANSSLPTAAADTAWTVPVPAPWTRVLSGQTVLVKVGYCIGTAPKLKGTVSTWLEAEFIAD